MKKTVIKNTLILVAISLSAALLLSVVYAVTKNTIAEAEEKERMDSFYYVLPNAKEFVNDGGDRLINFNNKNVGVEIISAYKGYDENGNAAGTVVSVVSHKGYGGDVTLSLGMDNNGVITGMKVTDMSETSGLGAECQNTEWAAQFTGLSRYPLTYMQKGQPEGDTIDALTGATITTKAVLEAVNAGLSYFAYANPGTTEMEAAK